jgi:hypothetical protein
MNPPNMNIARLTVMSLRRCTSRTTPRWSVNASSDDQCVEISKLGIDVEGSAGKAPWPFRSLPDDYSISIAIVVVRAAATAAG